MSFPRYPRYKDSGVEWLGEIPEHWRTSRLGFEAWVRARLGWRGLKAEEYVDDGFVFLSTPNIKSRSIDFENVNYISEQRYSESPEIQLRIGDVLLAKDGSLGMVNVVRSLPRAATVNSSIAVITPNNSLNDIYLHYLFQSRFMEETIQRIKGGMGVPHLFQEDIKKLNVPLPDLSEQIQIRVFLDQETGKIDALIEAQQRLIELLKEKHQAVISHAVTKGLDPTAPMKDSGVNWLGFVPAHWSVCPVFSRYQIQLGKMLDSANIRGDHLRSYLRVADVQWGKINLDDLPEMDFDREARSKFQLHPGDLLVNEGGSYPGRCAVWVSETECYYQKALHRLRPRRPDSDTTEFFFYVMYWASEFGIFVANGNEATIEHLPAERLRRYRFAFPPLAEQLAICQALRGEVEYINDLIEQAEKAVELLTERRAALISAAVTGKIDVRTPIKKPISSATTLNPELARPVLAAEILDRCNGPRTGRIKLQKLVHLCECHAQLEEIQGKYKRKPAGPFDEQMMQDIRSGLHEHRWYEEINEDGRFRYRALEHCGQHKKYLEAWKPKMGRIDSVLILLADAKTKRCEIISTLYAAWNDLLIDGLEPDEPAVIYEASSGERWHKNKEKIAPESWQWGLHWMKANGLLPTGYGSRTTLEAPR